MVRGLFYSRIRRRREVNWEEVCDVKVSSAYEFLRDEDIGLVLVEGETQKVAKREEAIERLIEAYGSDHDLIQTVLERKYPNGKYFWLCDFIDDSKRQEEHFHIRIWSLQNSKIIGGDLLKGEDIDYFYAIGSMYNNDCVGIVAKKENYKLKVSELNKIKDSLQFKVDLASDSNDKRRTNNYLEILE